MGRGVYVGKGVLWGDEKGKIRNGDENGTGVYGKREACLNWMTGMNWDRFQLAGRFIAREL